MRTERAIPVPAKLEVRSDGNEHVFTGYAAVFGAPSLPMPYTETVEPGCFARSLVNPPNGRQTFVVDHDDSRLLASTKTDRLNLAEDSTGLLTESRMVDTTYARDLRALAEADELSGMSFEFSATKGGAPFSSDGKRRSLKEVRLYHVTVLTGKTPAYTETTAAVRALANQLEAPYEDLSLLLDAVREGRRLTTDEWNLMGRAAAVVAPDVDQRWSSAAWDASAASWALGSLVELLGNETDDQVQADLLRTAIDALQKFITAETGEVGSDADKLESNALPTPNLEVARALLQRAHA
jgi:HK97 family phage prohead protease